MVFSIFVVVAVAAVAFVAGVLVGRNNKAMVEKIVEQHKAQWDSVMNEIQALKDKIKS